MNPWGRLINTQTVGNTNNKKTKNKKRRQTKTKKATRSACNACRDSNPRPQLRSCTQKAWYLVYIWTKRTMICVYFFQRKKESRTTHDACTRDTRHMRLNLDDTAVPQACPCTGKARAVASRAIPKIYIDI